MKKKYRSISELGLVPAVILSALLVLSPLVMAEYGEWHLKINDVSTPSGSDCPDMTGEDYIFGTLHSDIFPLYFEYSYDNGEDWMNLGPIIYSEEYEVYIFDLWTDWDWRLGDPYYSFQIAASDPAIDNFVCYY